MGLSNFPSAAEGVLPVLVMNTVLSVALLKNMARSLLQVVSGVSETSSSSSSSNLDVEEPDDMKNGRERRISIPQFKSLCHHNYSSSCGGGCCSSSSSSVVECCVCLCGFKADEEVSELSCKHFFHKGCLEKWFGNYKHTTCPLCRSIH